MTISYGQQVTVEIKRIKMEGGEPVIKNGFPVVDVFVVSGTVSGVFEPNWCSVYGPGADQAHAIIDLRVK